MIPKNRVARICVHLLGAAAILAAAPIVAGQAVGAPRETAPVVASPAEAAPAGVAPVAVAPLAVAPDDASVDRAIDRALGDHAKYQAVIVTLKQAVANHDAAAVAALVEYPLRVDIGGKKSHVRSANEFVARYARIMTPAIQKLVTEQPYAALFVNSEGIMFGRGELWLRGVCKQTHCAQVDVKIVTIQDNAYLHDRKS